MSDKQIHNDVVAELRFMPDIDDTNIDVQVNDGIVTLSGFVPSHNDRFHAECAAKRVRGVRGLANELRISLASADRHPDSELVRNCLAAIRSELPRLADGIQVMASDGHMTLEGTVAWHWERQRIESAVRAIAGVVTVNNLIVIAPDAMPGDIKRRIEAAFVRSAELDAHRISVDAQEGTITLRGTVGSLREKDEAQRTACSAPGVRLVRNEILVART
jgi:osmotically-inducible protein OsmY